MPVPPDAWSCDQPVMAVQSAPSRLPRMPETTMMLRLEVVVRRPALPWIAEPGDALLHDAEVLE